MFSNYIRGCFFNKSWGLVHSFPVRAVLPAVGWWFSRLLGPLFTCFFSCALTSPFGKLVHSRERGRVLELILTLVFRCTGVCFTGTGVGESIYSTVDSCNSTIPVTGAPWRSGEDISRRCHPRCPVGRAPVGEGVEGGGGGGGGRVETVEVVGGGGGKVETVEVVDVPG